MIPIMLIWPDELVGACISYSNPDKMRGCKAGTTKLDFDGRSVNILCIR